MVGTRGGASQVPTTAAPARSSGAGCSLTHSPLHWAASPGHSCGPAEAPLKHVLRHEEDGCAPGDEVEGRNDDVGLGDAAHSVPAEEEPAHEDGKSNESGKPEDDVGRLERQGAVRVRCYAVT